MKCKDVMKSEVKFLSPDDAVQQAAEMMRDENIGCLPVCDEGSRVLGVLTDRDIVMRAVAAGRPRTTPVSEVMSRETVTCSPEDDVRRAEGLMAKHQKSRILCVDSGGKLVGIISLSDIAQIEDGAVAAQTFRQVSSRESRLH